MRTRKINANMSGWQPVFDTIVEKHGGITALVFGIVWRYCNMKSGRCYASQATLAKKAGLKRNAVIKHLKILVDHGYLRQYYKSGKTSEYFLTGAVDMNVSITEVSDL